MNSFNNEKVRSNAVHIMKTRIPAVIFPAKDSNGDLYAVSVDFCENNGYEKIIPLRATASKITDGPVSSCLVPVASVDFDIFNYDQTNKLMRVFYIQSENDALELSDLDPQIRAALLAQIVRFGEYLNVDKIQLHSVSDKLSANRPEQFKFSEAYNAGFLYPSQSLIKTHFCPDNICMTKTFSSQNSKTTTEEENNQ